jgi:hypothetical protein
VTTPDESVRDDPRLGDRRDDPGPGR